MRFQNVLENARFSIRLLLIALLLFFISNMALIIAWRSSDANIRVDIPPQIPTSGFSVTKGEVPKAFVYSFAFYIWQQVNDWQVNGETDYPNNIKAMSAFLTPNFQLTLQHDANSRFEHGELQERLRSVVGNNGSSYHVSDVEVLGHHTWVVHLTMRLTERLNVNAKAVKSVVIHYALRVVKSDRNAIKNPWGLALDGFQTSPERSLTVV